MLKIDKQFFYSSSYKLKSNSTSKLVELIKLSNGTEYLSGQGGKKYLNEKLLFTNKINLDYLNYKQVEYEQQNQSSLFQVCLY